MKVIILSGAGLSVPSELPAYEDIKNTPEYQAFQGASPCEVLALVKKIRHQYEQFLPNRAHYECMYLERLCCVIKFKDRTTPFRVFLNQYDKFQAYLTQ
ncbi:hypothetical protein [Vibrio sp. 10N.237.312.B06]